MWNCICLKASTKMCRVSCFIYFANSRWEKNLLSIKVGEHGPSDPLHPSVDGPAKKFTNNSRQKQNLKKMGQRFWDIH